MKSLSMPSPRPSREANASSRLVRRSVEVTEKERATGDVGAARVDVEVGVGDEAAGGDTGEGGCTVDMNDKRGEGMIGGRTGGRSEAGVGTSGRVIDGAGFGEGSVRNESPDLLRMGERRGEGGARYAERGLLGPHLWK